MSYVADVSPDSSYQLTTRLSLTWFWSFRIGYTLRLFVAWPVLNKIFSTHLNLWMMHVFALKTILKPLLIYKTTLGIQSKHFCFLFLTIPVTIHARGTNCKLFLTKKRTAEPDQAAIMRNMGLQYLNIL